MTESDARWGGWGAGRGGAGHGLNCPLFTCLDFWHRLSSIKNKYVCVIKSFEGYHYVVIHIYAGQFFHSPRDVNRIPVMLRMHCSAYNQQELHESGLPAVLQQKRL